MYIKASTRVGYAPPIWKRETRNHSVFFSAVSTVAFNNIYNLFKERGGGQNFSTSFWMRFSQAPLCRYRFKFIFDDIIFLLSGIILEYICF